MSPRADWLKNGLISVLLFSLDLSIQMSRIYPGNTAFPYFLLFLSFFSFSLKYPADVFWLYSGKQNKILDDLNKLKYNIDEPIAGAIHGPLAIFS